MLAPSLGREDPVEEGTQHAPVLLPGELHGQRSLAGCSPQGRQSDTTEQLSTHLENYQFCPSPPLKFQA